MSKAISRVYLGILALVVIVGGVAYAYYALQPAAPQQAAPVPKPAPVPQPQQPAPAPAPPPASPRKFKASGFSTGDVPFLLRDAGKDRGIYASNGLDPEWITIPGQIIQGPVFKEQVTSGIKIGLSTQSEVLLARANGVPVKIVAAATGELPGRVYVKADGPIKTVKDLDGKKVGVITAGQGRNILYVSNKVGVKTESVALGNLTNQIAALRSGRVDAILSAEGVALRLIDSGEAKLLIRLADVFPKPFVTFVVFATDDLIQQNPDLVKGFVKATLETVKHLKENPSYAADLYMKRKNAPKDLADKVLTLIDWTPSRRGSGQDLVAGVTNAWQVQKDIGAVPAGTTVKVEEAIDTRFLQ